MCGIIGVFGKINADELAKKGLEAMKHRGSDAVCFSGGNGFCIGHRLHSIVGFVKQPMEGKGIFTSNCEIYNWKEICAKLQIEARNDSELLFRLLESKGAENLKEILEMLDGVYAFAYLRDGKLWLARDIIGVKPLWYSITKGFAFASEKKALEAMGFININELNPRKILVYGTKKNKIELTDREFFKITPLVKGSLKEISEKVKLLLEASLKKRVPERKFGLLFSGGLDSTVLALMLKSLGCSFTCYTAVLEDEALKAPQDLVFAEKIAKEYQLEHKAVKIKLKDIEPMLKKIVPLIEDYNVVKAGVALTFYAACEEAGKDGCKVIFSGLGSEELFAGYERHKLSSDVNKECVSGLLKMYERDTYRDDTTTMYHSLELRLPFLDKALAEYSLRIPPHYKLSEGREKFVLREVARSIGLKEEYASRPKKAAQYGSNFHKAIGKLSRKKGFRLMSDYLRQFYPSHNLKLGALVSSGKDSIYAMYVMMKQNYPVECMIAIRSKNPDSYMFHTPAIDMVKLQSGSIGIPLIEQDTEGEKEKELEDLKKALQEAKEKYRIEGVITGALFSSYQRDRIEKACDSLSLKIFSPLWHMDQETEIRQIINAGFEFVITKIAAEGLTKEWLGRVITPKDVDRLAELNRKIGINIAFEGGEAETLMVNGPIFSKRIELRKFRIIEQDKNTAELLVEEAVLA